MDEYGIIQANRRLQHAEYLPYDTRYPIILPREDWVTKVKVNWYHEKANHIAGTNHTLSVISKILGTSRTGRNKRMTKRMQSMQKNEG